MGTLLRKGTINMSSFLFNALENIKIITSIFDKFTIRVYCIRNDFFGEDITVTGLLTGQDIVRQLKEKEVGKYLLIPDCVLRSKELVLLDDMTVSDLEKALQVSVGIVKSNGCEFIASIVND